MFCVCLQPKGATLAVRVLIILAGTLAVASVGAGQTPAGRPPASNRPASQAPTPLPKASGTPPSLGTPSKSAVKAPNKVGGTAPQKTVTPRVAPAAGRPARQIPVSKPLPINRVKTPAPLPPPKPAPHPQPPATPPVTTTEAPGQEPGAESNGTATSGNPPIAAGRRDPFKPWVAPSLVSRSAAESAPLPAGPRGLVISALRLEGVVRQDPGSSMIAVVTNATKRAYFLRVNDAVHNGVVSKITPEAIYFKENMLDSQGRVATHEVEIKLGSAAGEGR